MVEKAVPEKHLHEKDNLLFPKKLNKAANSVKSQLLFVADNSTNIISKYIQESLLRVTYYLKTEKFKENRLIESPHYTNVRWSYLG